jgi:hypothetical protein
MVYRALLAIGLILVIGHVLRAQSDGIPITDRDLVDQQLPLPGYPPVLNGPAVEAYPLPPPECGDPLGEPPGCPPPCEPTSVRIGIEFNPTTSKIHGDGFGFWTDESVAASRISIRHENPDGVGWRVQFWDFEEEVRAFPRDIDIEASTLYLDAEKTFHTGGAELTFGGGLAGARLAIDRFREDQFIGIGGSIFGEAYYPFLRFTKADLGVTGHGRLAVLGSVEEDIIHNRVALIDDFGWGLEFRRRFGARQDKFWYVNVEREIQLWESSSHINAADEVFQGTSFKFGVAW